jgi:hypothetical protein
MVTPVEGWLWLLAMLILFLVVVHRKSFVCMRVFQCNRRGRYSLEVQYILLRWYDFIK